MAESLTTKFFEQDKINEEQTYKSQFDSSEYHPDQFGVGAVTGKVFEELYEEQDEWEIFFTYMFFLGIILIPVQLIFADDLKPFDAFLIEKIQYYILTSHGIFKTIIEWTFYSLGLVANFRFFTSITIFFYLCFDPGVAYKTSLIAGLGVYLVFILKIIIHDSRPYWISSNIQPSLCKISFGSPSLDVFVGMLYSHYIFFCTQRALMSDDPIIEKNRSAVQVSFYISIILMCANALLGVSYFCLGENFIYQILITFFYGFIIIRIIIIFNKDIDHFANGSRFIIGISNVSSIIVMFVIIILSLASCIIYEIVNQDLLISREWSKNISLYCYNKNESGEISIRYTFIDSASIFHILGASFGVNLVLKHIGNPYYWFITPWSQRLIRGAIGFIVNYCIVSLSHYTSFRVLTAEYIFHAIVYGVSGYISYGCLPIFYSYINLTNDEYINKKREKMRKLSEPFIDHDKINLTPEFQDMGNKDEYDSLRIDEEDKEYERYSK